MHCEVEEQECRSVEEEPSREKEEKEKCRNVEDWQIREVEVDESMRATLPKKSPVEEKRVVR